MHRRCAAGASEDEVAAVLEAVGLPSRRQQSPAREVSPTLLLLACLEGSCVIHSQVEWSDPGPHL